MVGNVMASNKTSRFSFRSIARVGVELCIALFLIVLIGGSAFAVSVMKYGADSSLASARPQIENKVDEAFNLLESLASQQMFYDPDVPVEQKYTMLDQLNERYGYFLICYVDADINVWDETGAASLASRDYMQRLYSTGERLVTDSFAAGADGVTLNYSVVVPLVDENGSLTGSLFAALYFDDAVNVLEASLADSSVGAVLIGSRGQVMSATEGYVYDEKFLEPISSSIISGITIDRIESELLSMRPVEFWTFEDFDLKYYTAAPVAETEWDIICVSSFRSVFGTMIGGLLVIAAVSILFVALAFALIRRRFVHQMAEARRLERSMEELERKVYRDGGLADSDFADILELTSTGLSDGLTGVVTRSVFTSRLEGMLAKAPSDRSLWALCFIDLDDFKTINDTYGHAAGDEALKRVGRLLREYERRYEGLAGRYGGDEFVVLLTDIDGEDELRAILAEMIEKLHIGIGVAQVNESFHCSIGASVWDGKATAEQLLEQADQAMYWVKQIDKGEYRVYQDGEPS